MEVRNSSLAIRISITKTLLMALALLWLTQDSAVGSLLEQESPVQSLVATKIAARLAEENFWSGDQIKNEVKLVLFLSIDKHSAANFDGLVVVPELRKHSKCALAGTGQRSFWLDQCV